MSHATQGCLEGCSIGHLVKRTLVDLVHPQHLYHLDLEELGDSLPRLVLVSGLVLVSTALDVIALICATIHAVGSRVDIPVKAWAI